MSRLWSFFQTPNLQIETCGHTSYRTHTSHWQTTSKRNMTCTQVFLFVGFFKRNIGFFQPFRRHC
jgi:hypothetical protein